MSSPSLDTRYHHYIPQFLLKNFSHPGQSSNRGKSRGKGNSRAHTKPSLNAINLSGEKVEIIETPVRRTFGIQDLYVDSQNSQNIQHIEELLGKLEGSASRVINKVREKFERIQGIGGQVVLTRPEKDVLRKFLFVMRYRKSNIKKCHDFQSVEDYLGPDKEEFAEYMQKRGFTRPLDVWLDNLKVFIETKIDADVQRWKNELLEKAYPPHAMLFIIHLDLFYLALCTPSNPQDEFIMTENGYGIHEGPVTTYTDPITQRTRTIYTEYHIFAHISPRLTMVLRSQHLPLPAEDVIESIRAMREAMHFLSTDAHQRPEASISWLQDLPITKARNSYSKIENGVIVSLRGGEAVLGPNDQFFFKFFPLETESMNKINCVFLEEGHSISTIVFNKKISLRRAIEYYLLLEVDKRSLKQVSGPEDPRMLYLKKLEQVMTLLGRNISAKYHIHSEGSWSDPTSIISGTDQVFSLLNADTSMKTLYHKLRNLSHSSSPQTEPLTPTRPDPESLNKKDFSHAALMLKLRIKLDSLSQGFNESLREEARNDIRDDYCENLPMQQMWIYLKRFRFMLNGGTIIGTDNRIVDTDLQAKFLPGPEDDIAQVAEIFKPTYGNRMMFYATMNHITLSKPSYGVPPAFLQFVGSHEAVRNCFTHERATMFGSQGSICDCGFPELEFVSRKFRSYVKLSGPTSAIVAEFGNLLEKEEMEELAVRELSERYFSKVLAKSASLEMEGLMRVLFGIVFLGFGAKIRWEEDREMGKGEDRCGCLACGKGWRQGRC